MRTETLPEIVETSNSGYRGFQVPEALRWEGLRKNLGTGIEAYRASMESTTATVWLSFYSLGEDIIYHEENGEELPEEIKRLPEADRELGKELYLDCQRRAKLRDPEHPDHGKWQGVWFKDAVDFDVKKPTPRVVPEGYIYAVYIKGVENWDVNYMPLDGERIPAEIPVSNGAFAVPKGIHVYDQLTGVPKKVEPNKKKALKAWMDTGLTQEQAERRMSRVYSMRDSGIAVVRSNAGPGGGPLYLSFCGVPGSRSSSVGSVAASRLASGASPDSGNVVPQSEYDILSAKNKELGSRADSAERKLAKIRADLEE